MNNMGLCIIAYGLAEGDDEQMGRFCNNLGRVFETTGRFYN